MKPDTLSRFVSAKPCTFEGCDRGIYAKGLCEMHYARWRRYGDPAIVNKAKPQTCSVEDCDRPAHGHGYCSMHVRRWKKYGDPTAMAPPPPQFCSIDDCDRPHKGRGLCSMHLARLNRSGTLARRSSGPTPPEVRFWKHVHKTETCWLWTASDNGRGYGVLSTGERPGHKVYAHRLSYEMHVGSIPEGHHIDHLCKVRNCVNPEHLEAVTPEENNRRSDSVSAQLTRKTHCKRGHPLSGDNLYLQQVKDRPNPARQCRECGRIRAREAAKRKRATQ